MSLAVTLSMLAEDDGQLEGDGPGQPTGEPHRAARAHHALARTEQEIVEGAADEFRLEGHGAGG